MTLAEERDEITMSEELNQRANTTMETLCRRCAFHPASPRIAGYCSWDCYDADDEDESAADDEGGKAA